MSPAVINSRYGNIRMRPDLDGVIRIKYDPKLARENPFVKFPGDGTLMFSATQKNSLIYLNQGIGRDRGYYCDPCAHWRGWSGVETKPPAQTGGSCSYRRVQLTG
jgi:hypothetical protein